MIAIVVFAALIVTCTMVVYRRRKKYRGSERGRNDFKTVRVKRKCFLCSNYDEDQFRNDIFIYTKNVERVKLYYIIKYM